MHTPLRAGLVLFFAAAVIAATCHFALAQVTIDLSDLQNTYAPGKPITGDIKVRFNTVLPADTILRAYINDAPVSSVQFQPLLAGVATQYKQYPFTYIINATGDNRWDEYPSKSFYFKLRATGTCGDQECAPSGACDCGQDPVLCTPPTGPPYSCIWSLDTDFVQASISAADGTTEIADGLQYIGPPTNENGDTIWSQINNVQDVQTSMRTYCGGWQRTTLASGVQVPGKSGWMKFTIEPFDEASLTTDWQKFPEGDCKSPYVCGGIYRNVTRLIALNSQFSLNGSLGEITVKSYDPKAIYTVTYLPPNGPKLCAYTSYKVVNSSQWTASSPSQSGMASYDKPFSKSYSIYELPQRFNDTNILKALVKPDPCPDYVQSCNQSAAYSVSKASDSTPGGSIQVSFVPPRNVSATQSAQDITEKFLRISLSNFSNLKAPSAINAYSLAFALESTGNQLARSEMQFSICEDKDGDGYCADVDCNDSNPNIHPGATELCNGIDDNCDGQIDEAFKQAGKMLGDSCGTGACSGKWVCSKDNKSVVCSAPSVPGPEICGNGIDDDCDGVVDEQFETGPDGNLVRACNECTDGETDKPCGSNVGECKVGHRICVNGQWNMNVCVGGKGPTEEVCNGKDDNCDGIIDNVGMDVGETSTVQETQCGCYGGAAPSTEICDGIDNNCDGQIDEIGGCCSDGQTRSCGTAKGICTQGRQTCIAGQWAQCIGGMKPSPEICYNGLDDNCNGKIDELCTPSVTCHNGIQDLNEQGIDCGGPCPQGCGVPYNWLLFAGGIILLIVAVAMLELKGFL